MQLGIILAPNGHVPNAWPYEIGYGYGGNGNFLCPSDPMYMTRGEYGLYHDTMLGRAAKKPGFLSRLKRKMGLGSIPSDFDLGTIYGYTPVNSGWIATREGYYTGPWIPPDGYRPGGQDFAPKTWPRELGDAMVSPPDPTTASVLEVLTKQNDRLFTLSVVSTIAGATAALLVAYRTLKSLKKS